MSVAPSKEVHDGLAATVASELNDTLVTGEPRNSATFTMNSSTVTTQSISSQAVTASESVASCMSTIEAHQMASQTIFGSENCRPSMFPGINFNINENDFEDNDFEDDFSDEFYEDDEEEECMDVSNQMEVSDVTKQLLNFTENINSDIQKYFGPRKDEEDSCDIYEDKWLSKKSGRELYIADILRIANGADPTEDTKGSERRSITKRRENKKQYYGNSDSSVGLGPLEELFKDVAASNEKDLKTAALRKDRKPKRLQYSLQERKLPPSFWIEPSGKYKGKEATDSIKGGGKSCNVATQSQLSKGAQPSTPDFSDLLESWAGEVTSAAVTPKQTTVTSVLAGHNSAVACR